MKPQNAKREFEALLLQRELSLTILTIDQACKVMLDFYRLHRAEGCDVAAEGDMLLYQWDVVVSEVHGRCLEMNLTRQFSLAEISDEESDSADDSEEDVNMHESSDDDESGDNEPIWQLSLTMLFPLQASTEAVVPGNKWCSTPRPQAVDYFEKFIRESPAYQWAVVLKAVSVELDYFNAG